MDSEKKKRRRNIPDGDLLSDLIKVAATLGKMSVEYREYDAMGQFTSATLANRFGCWNDALVKAGLMVKNNHNINPTRLLNDIKRVADEYGKQTITAKEYNKKGKYGSTTISVRFGGWNQAIEAAGLNIKYIRNVSVETLFENWVWVRRQLGRRPVRRDMKAPLSKFTESPYITEFGSWRKAVAHYVALSKPEEKLPTSETKPESVIQPEIEAKAEQPEIQPETQSQQIETQPAVETKAELTNIQPEQPATIPEYPEIQPEIQPEKPAIQPEQPATLPEVIPEIQPEQPATQPEIPEIQPVQPGIQNMESVTEQPENLQSIVE